MLNELLKEYHNNGDDLVKPENEENVSILADIDDLLKVEKTEEEANILQRRKEKLAELNSLVQHLQDVYHTKEALEEIFDKVKMDADDIKQLTSKKQSFEDDIIVSDSNSDKIDSSTNINSKLNNESEISENNNNKNAKNSDEDIKTRITHAVDEL